MKLVILLSERRAADVDFLGQNPVELPALKGVDMVEYGNVWANMFKDDIVMLEL